MMASGTYLITLDVLDPTLDLDGLKTFIKTDAMFENWWNHIPGVFLVVSTQDAAAISNAVRPFTREARMLVIKTSPDDSEGWLTDQAWRWVKRRAQRAKERSAAE